MRSLLLWILIAPPAWATCVDISAPTVPQFMRHVVVMEVMDGFGCTEQPTAPSNINKQPVQLGQTTSKSICYTLCNPSVLTDKLLEDQYALDEAARQTALVALTAKLDQAKTLREEIKITTPNYKLLTPTEKDDLIEKLLKLETLR